MSFHLEEKKIEQTNLFLMNVKAKLESRLNGKPFQRLENIGEGYPEGLPVEKTFEFWMNFYSELTDVFLNFVDGLDGIKK